jgi:hypothetical protein
MFESLTTIFRSQRIVLLSRTHQMRKRDYNNLHLDFFYYWKMNSWKTQLNSKFPILKVFQYLLKLSLSLKICLI